jgi:hypothetical protein
MNVLKCDAGEGWKKSGGLIALDRAVWELALEEAVDLWRDRLRSDL